MITVNNKVQEAINSRVKIFTMLGEPMKHTLDRFMAQLEECKTEDEIIQLLINPYPARFLNGYPDRKHLNDVVKSEKIILTEKVRIKHIVDGDGNGFITEKNLSIYPLTVRRNQQIIFKEAKSAKAAEKRTVTGTVTSEDKSGAMTDSEIYVAIGHNAQYIQKEVLGFGSSDLVAKKASKEQILRTGEINMKELPEDKRNKLSLRYLHHKMRMMGYDCDVITQPL